jgi:hypothetical protein
MTCLTVATEDTVEANVNAQVVTVDEGTLANFPPCDVSKEILTNSMELSTTREATRC